LVSAQFTREDFAGLVFNLEQKKPIGRADLRLYSRGEVHEDGGNFFVWLNRVDPRNTPLPENLWGIFEAQLADGTRIDLGAFRTNVNNIRANLTTIGAQTFPDMPVGTREGVLKSRLNTAFILIITLRLLDHTPPPDNRSLCYML